MESGIYVFTKPEKPKPEIEIVGVGVGTKKVIALVPHPSGVVVPVHLK